MHGHFWRQFFMLVGAAFFFFHSFSPNCEPNHVICLCKDSEYNIWSNVKTIWTIKRYFLADVWERASRVGVSKERGKETVCIWERERESGVGDERGKGAGPSRRCERLGASHFSKRLSRGDCACQDLMWEISFVHCHSFFLLVLERCTSDTSGGIVCVPKERELWM